MKVVRHNLIDELQSVMPGTSQKAEELQCGCFIFRDGHVATFNGEVCCRRPSLLDFKELKAAVPAEPLLSLLEKMTEEEVSIELDNGKFVVAGKNKRARYKYEKTIDSPIASVEDAETWKKMPADFLEAISVVHQSASEDVSQFNLTCIHIHPQWLEACDNWQLTRFKFETGLSTPILVKQKALKHIVGLGPSKFAETPAFIHFRRKDGLIISCRRYVETYPELSKFLKTEGSPWIIPKGLKDASEKAEVFANKSGAHLIKITIQPGKLSMFAEGEQGDYMEVKRLEYEGDPLSFKISPKMMKELADKHNEVLISQKKIKVNSGKCEFAAALELPNSKEKSNGKPRQKDKEEE